MKKVNTYKEGYKNGKFTKPINRFVTGGIYHCKFFQTTWRVIRRTDHTLWIVQLVAGEGVGNPHRVRVKEHFELECEFAYTKSPQAYIQSVSRKETNA